MDKKIFATIKMVGGGKMRIALDPSSAPETVKNFTDLVGKRYYDGLCFHRVIDGFMIQGGGFRQSGDTLISAPALPPIRGEFSSNGVKNGIKHKKGVISMARTVVKNSATSQFFICVADTPFLDGEYAAFGACADEESIATAVAISKVATRTIPAGYDDVPEKPVIIETIVLE